jgi:type II secretory pathway pseudopilin PulG
MELRPSRQTAFTLLELLLTAGMLVILSSVALRTMFVFSEQRKLRTAAVELAGYLEVARSVAEAENEPCMIALTSSSGGSFEPDTSTTNKCTPAKANIPPAVRLGSHSGSRDLAATVTSGSFPLTFSPEGTVRSGATVKLSSANVPDGAWCVDVSAPLATVRLGWQQGDDSCTSANYAIEQ